MRNERLLAIAAVAVAVVLALFLTFRTETSHPVPPLSGPDKPGPYKVAPPVVLTAAQDHARLLKVLGLSALRAPAPAINSGDIGILPDPLKLNDGRVVGTPEIWWQQRRQEIADTMEIEVYGQMRGPGLLWKDSPPVPEAGPGIAATTRRVSARVATTAGAPTSTEVPLTLTVPDGAAGHVPVVLVLAAPDDVTPSLRSAILGKGWAIAVLDVTRLQPNTADDLPHGAIGAGSEGKPRDPKHWGVLRVWAWGASRAMDYLEGASVVDSAHVAIAGHGTYGKAAMIAMAYDPRFAVAFISSSGIGGASLLRREPGTGVETLAGLGSYQMFAGNFLKYAGKRTAKDLPVDTHDLFALAAPRPIFISASAADPADDPQGAFLAATAANPVYKLLGKTGIAATTMPAVNTQSDTGEIAFHMRDGASAGDSDWPAFVAFAERYLHGKSTP